uniref:Uncharacterized protein n=1 Tax=Anguilla anguilla TaxID=7936 RepID=A0A0E9SC60_ANGAN
MACVTAAGGEEEAED